MKRFALTVAVIATATSCGQSRFDVSQVGTGLSGVSYSVAPGSPNELEVQVAGETITVKLNKSVDEKGLVGFTSDEAKDGQILQVASGKKSKLKIESVEVKESTARGFYNADSESLKVIGLRPFEEANKMKPLRAMSVSSRELGIDGRVILQTGLALPKHELVLELSRAASMKVHVTASKSPMIQTDRDGMIRIVLDFPKAAEAPGADASPVLPVDHGPSTENIDDLIR